MRRRSFGSSMKRACYRKGIKEGLKYIDREREIRKNNEATEASMERFAELSSNGNIATDNTTDGTDKEISDNMLINILATTAVILLRIFAVIVGIGFIGLFLLFAYSAVEVIIKIISLF